METKPNILIIHTDQQRYDSLGCTGNACARTPNIDRLAAEGTLFTRHIASNTICMPSRASLMTGLYPIGHGVWDNGVPLSRREYVRYNADHPELESVVQPGTMADVFAGAGYRTAMFGKLHLTPFLAPSGCPYQEAHAQWREKENEMNEWHGPYYGFEYVDMLVGHGPFPDGHHKAWLKREHPGVFDAVAQGSKKRGVPGVPDLYTAAMPLELHHTMWLADRVDRYLDSVNGKNQPFFAFVGFPDPHHPFTPTNEAVREFDGTPVAGPYDEEGSCWRDYISGGKGGARPGMLAGLRTADRETILRYTNAMVWQIDCAVGRILDSLERRSLRRNTIVVFTSDHGDFLCDHGLLRKGAGAAHQLLHVPCILSVPGRKGGERNDTVMSNCDLLPTLAGLAGVGFAGRLDGRDVFDGGPDEQHAFADCSAGMPESINYTVYDEAYRYTVYPRIGKEELFDHTQDPWEAANLALSPSANHRETMRRLKERIQEHLLMHGSPTNGRISAW